MRIIEAYKKHKVPTILISMTTGLIGSVWKYDSKIFHFLKALYPSLADKAQQLTTLSIILLILLLASVAAHIVMIIRRKNKFSICPRCNESTFKPLGIANDGSIEEFVGFRKTRFMCSICGYSKDILNTKSISNLPQ
jgi:ribosomal protein S27AE